jgi:hypothetical protein
MKPIPIELPGVYLNEEKLGYSMADLIRLSDQINALYLQSQAMAVRDLLRDGLIHTVRASFDEIDYHFEASYPDAPETFYSSAAEERVDVAMPVSELEIYLDWHALSKYLGADINVSLATLEEFLQGVYGSQYPELLAEERALDLEAASQPAMGAPSPRRPKF